MPILNLARTMPMVRTILPPIEFCCWPNTCSTRARTFERLKAKGLQSRIHRRAARNHPLSERQKSANTGFASICTER